jgi:hypothetical protein
MWKKMDLKRFEKYLATMMNLLRAKEKGSVPFVLVEAIERSMKFDQSID